MAGGGTICSHTLFILGIVFNELMKRASGLKKGLENLLEENKSKKRSERYTREEKNKWNSRLNYIITSILKEETKRCTDINNVWKQCNGKSVQQVAAFDYERCYNYTSYLVQRFSRGFQKFESYERNKSKNADDEFDLNIFLSSTGRKRRRDPDYDPCEDFRSRVRSYFGGIVDFHNEKSFEKLLKFVELLGQCSVDYHSWTILPRFNEFIKQILKCENITIDKRIKLGNAYKKYNNN